MHQFTTIQQLIGSYQSAFFAQKHFDKVKVRLIEEQKQLANLSAALEKEQLDVLKMQHLTLKGIFHSILGDKKQQYEIEKQEYLMATMAYNEAEYYKPAVGISEGKNGGFVAGVFCSMTVPQTANFYRFLDFGLTL